MKRTQIALAGTILCTSAVALAAGWFQNSSAGRTGNSIVQTSSSANATASTSLKWNTDLEAALERSRTSGKPVFVDFYATWCPPCKIMDNKTFQDEAVKAELQRYELVKIDVDKSAELAASYGIQALPTLVCLKPEGTRSNFLGYHSPEKLIKVLKGCNKDAADSAESRVQ